MPDKQKFDDVTAHIWNMRMALWMLESQAHHFPKSIPGDLLHMRYQSSLEMLREKLAALCAELATV